MSIVEGDSRYASNELFSDAYLENNMKDVGKISKADVFSLGLTILRLISGKIFNLPKNGAQWFQYR